MEYLLTLLYRVGTELVIRLKWGQTEYKGTLESIDSYMNVLLRDTEEYIDGKHTGTLGLVLIRCVQLSSGYVMGHWSAELVWNPGLLT
jgi:small nuclear ribonucleoprotein (snRNP)-like protein